MKRLLWMIILVLTTAFSVVFTSVDGFTSIFNPTPIVMPTEITLTFEPTEVTAVPTEIVPTQTVEPTVEITPTVTEIPLPTATAAPTETPLPTATVTPIPTPTATAMPFKVQAMTPVFMTNFVHTDAACNWQGVAGQVFDANLVPVLNYIVKVSGTYSSQPVSLVGITGMVTGKPYGPGSYEIVLGNAPVTSTDTLIIQLFDPNGDPVSDPQSFSTSNECSKNLVLINFQHK
ncbi:MAG TPA: hypothetical protein DDW19_08320 [Anaerolineaceae bacterium]|jgi:hypothetical protein|nr:hypothetical protein [Anaerolineaceae bacterium]